MKFPEAPSGLTAPELVVRHAEGLRSFEGMGMVIDWWQEYSAHLNRWKDEGYLTHFTLARWRTPCSYKLTVTVYFHESKYTILV